MSRSFKTILFILTVILATACNSDLFVEDDGLETETAVYVDGDGGETVFNIDTKELKSIRVDDISGPQVLWYYDKDGNDFYYETNDLRDLAKISYRSDFVAYDIDVNGGRLKVHTIENASGEMLRVCVRLVYSYTTKVRILNIGIGKPLELTDITYDNCFTEQVTYDLEPRHFKVRNNGPIQQKIEVQPYLQCYARALVKPSESWAFHKKKSMRLPTFANGILDYGEEQQVELASVFPYKTKSWDTAVSVDIPANSVVDIVSTIAYSRIVTNGAMKFRLPVSGREYETLFTTTVVEPISYKITVEDAD